MQHGKCLNANTQSSSNKEEDAAAALRAELKIELKNKKQCTYQPYECTQLSIDGYAFCTKHILQDKNAPFKQCSYIYNSNGKRCHLPAPRGDRKDYGYCSEHALKATLTKNKHNSKYPPPRTAEVLLHSLSHYIKKPRIRSSSTSTQHSDDGERAAILDEIDQKTTKSLDPFVDLDACSTYNEACNQVLDFCSESESDIEASTYSSVWHDAQADSSDDESIDSEQEDVLKHANVYTAEEITLMTRDKLIRLQSLYIEQYRHLKYLLKEKRRKYLHALKREKETCCNIYNQVRDNPKEQRLYKKLKALNNYQKCHGVDAILNKRLNDLRVKVADGSSTKGQVYSKCSFSEGGVKCGERSLPLAKYCQKHILEDTNQVLFRACGKLTGDVKCTTPIAAIFDESMCALHLEIPPLRSYCVTRKDSESDIDESTDSQLHFSTQLTENVKTEFLNYDTPPEIPKMETVPSLLFEENTTNESSDGNDFILMKNEVDDVIEESLDMKMNEIDGAECVPNEIEISMDSERTLSADVLKTNAEDVKSESDDANNMMTDEIVVDGDDNSHCLEKSQQISQLDVAEKDYSDVKSESVDCFSESQLIETEMVTENDVNIFVEHNMEDVVVDEVTANASNEKNDEAVISSVQKVE